MMFCLVGCKTIKQSESTIDKHYIETLMQRMDSFAKYKQVIQVDTSWHKTFIKELQSIKEKSDTSHMVVVDTIGNVIREKIIINNTREVTSEKERKELEFVRHSLEKMDSTLSVANERIMKLDSAYQQSKKESVKEVVKVPKIYTYSLVFSILVIIFAIFKVIRWLKV